MARIRSIKPELPHDAKLARVSRDARYTFVLLWTVADDHGYFRAATRWLAGSLYPHEEVPNAQIEQWMGELAGVGVIELLALADGSPVGRIVNWTKHQRVDNAAKSFIRDQLGGESRKLSAKLGELRQDAEASGDPPQVSARRGESRSPEPRVLSPESRGDPLDRVAGFANLREKLDLRYHAGLTAYVRAAHQPAALCATILAEGPDTGTNGTAGRTWAVIGQALLEMQAAGKPFTPNLLRAFCRKLQEVGAGGEILTESERMTAAAKVTR